MSLEKPCIGCDINNNNYINKITPNNPPKQANSSYALSSWNYGSFHHSNPRFSKPEQPVKLIGAAEPLKDNGGRKPERPQTAQVINKFGKRKLAENEKIVTEEFLKAMNDNKNIRGTSRKLNQNRSTANLRNSSINKNSKADSHQINYISNNYENQNTSNSNLVRNNYTENSNNNNNDKNYIQNKNFKINQVNSDNTQQIYNVSRNSQDQRNRSRFSSKQRDKEIEREKEKIFKFGMTFDEWSENKNRQIQVIKNLNILKDHELKEYEKIEEKIEDNYKKIKEQNVKEWMQKKLEMKKQEELRKQKEEELKQMKKQQKELEKQEKLEKWFQKQANLTEMELLEKKRKEEEEKLKLEKKQKVDLLKKLEAEQAYQEWLRKKQQDEKKNKEINESNEEPHKNSNVNQRRNSLSKNNMHHNSHKKKTSAIEDKLKINIGPYSIAKELREYKRKLVEDLEEMGNYNQSGLLDEQQQNDYDDYENEYMNDQGYEIEGEIGNPVAANDYRKQEIKEKVKPSGLDRNGNANAAKSYKNFGKQGEIHDINQHHIQNNINSQNQNRVVFRRENTDPNLQEEFEEEEETDNAKKAQNYNDNYANENSENFSNNAQQYQIDQEEQDEYDNENENVNYINNQNFNENKRHVYLDNFEKEKIEDSLQELSSIKKDTPAQDDD